MSTMHVSTPPPAPRNEKIENIRNNFEKAKKGKNCSNFSLTGVDLGTCMRKFDAYPEMNAVTCDDYKR